MLGRKSTCCDVFFLLLSNTVTIIFTWLVLRNQQTFVCRASFYSQFEKKGEQRAEERERIRTTQYQRVLKTIFFIFFLILPLNIHLIKLLPDLTLFLSYKNSCIFHLSKILLPTCYFFIIMMQKCLLTCARH